VWLHSRELARLDALASPRDSVGATISVFRQIEVKAMSKLRHPSSDIGARDLLAP